MALQFNLEDYKTISRRRVYDSVAFLGDIGGLYSSMWAIGSVLYFLISANESSMQLLRNYFRVDSGPPSDTAVSNNYHVS